MKKLNLFLACAAVAVASVFGLSSCDKEDNPGKDGGSKDVVKTYDYLLCANDEILDGGDILINVVKDGKPTEYNLKNGTEKKIMYKGKNYTGKEMVFSNLKKGDTAEPKFVAKEGAFPAGGNSNPLIVRLIKAYKNNVPSSIDSKSDTFAIPGLDNEKVQNYVEQRLAASKFKAE